MRIVMGSITHAIALTLGVALGIYLLPILTTPPPLSPGNHYESDFIRGSDGWETIHIFPKDAIVASKRKCSDLVGSQKSCPIEVPIVDGYMQLQSPWHHDPNHRKPGAGHLVLVAWRIVDRNVGFIDLADSELYMEIRFENLDLMGGDLLFWFQTTMPSGKKSANFALTGDPILSPQDGPTNNKTVVINLSSDPKQWTCLGASVDNQYRYGCMDVSTALQRVVDDFGFIIFPAVEGYIPAELPTGTIEVKKIKISKQSSIFTSLRKLLSKVL